MARRGRRPKVALDHGFAQQADAQAPLEVLGVAPDADEATIRRAYLTLLRQHGPGRDPVRFQAIRAAYDTLRSPARRARLAVEQPNLSGEALDGSILAVLEAAAPPEPEVLWRLLVALLRQELGVDTGSAPDDRAVAALRARLAGGGA